MTVRIKRYIRQRGVWELAMTIIISSLFLGPLSFLSRVYQPALFVCLIVYLGMLRNAKVGWAEVLLVMACGFSIVFGNPLPIFHSWLRLGLFCLVLLITTPLLSSPSIEIARIRMFNWLSLICVATGVGSFFSYFLGINYMKSFYSSGIVQLGGGYGGLTTQSMLLGPLSALGFLRCVYLIVHDYSKGIRSSYSLYFICFTCFSSLLMASSRGAAGSALFAICCLVFIKLRHKLGKLIKLIMCIICLSIPLSPIVDYFCSGLIAKQAGNIESGGTFNSRENLWNDRLEEFLDSPISGVGFSSQRIISSKVTLLTGQVEPGSSHGAVFAMTGVIGGSIFLYILLSSLFQRKGRCFTLAQVYLIFFAIHMFVEGYVFAGGSPLCFIFWLCIGAACAIKNNQQLNQLIA